MKYIINTSEETVSIVWDGIQHNLEPGGKKREGVMVEDHIARRFVMFHPDAVELHELSGLTAVKPGHPDKGYRLKTEKDVKAEAGEEEPQKPKGSRKSSKTTESSAKKRSEGTRSSKHTRK